MNSITAVLAWDYLRRNLLPLLFVAFFANIPCIFILLPLKGIYFSEHSQFAMPILTVVTWCITIITVYGVIITQRQISGLYLKPITTLAIVTHFYWAGAATVICLMAIIVWLWRWLAVPDFPIAWPLLFGVVSWGVVQPWFSIGVKSMRTGLIPLMLVVVLCLWYGWRQGLFLDSNQEKTAAYRIGVGPSAIDMLVGAAAVASGFGLSVWRVTRDRAGRHPVSLLSRLGDRWERWHAANWVTRPQSFATPADAYESFVFRGRAIAIPSAIVVVLAIAWVCALIAGAASRSLGKLLEVAMIGSVAAAEIQVAIAAAVAILSYFYSPQRPMSKPFGSGRKSPLSANIDATRFFQTLPISNRELAAATTRSSLKAIGLSTVAITASLVLVGFIRRITSTEIALMNNDDTRLAAMSLVMTFGSAFVSFVLMSVSFIHRALAAQRTIWLSAIVILGSWLVIRPPSVASLGVAILVWLLAGMVFLTIRDLRSGDVTPLWAALIWGGGVTLTAVISVVSMNAFPERFEPQGALLVTYAVALVMLPFLATPEAVRRIRVS